jgi:Nuclear transport factor 2 (NTF2) domain
MMSFNGPDFAKGAQEIAEKLRSLTFQTISHNLSTMDIQPTYDNCIMIVVTGALKVRRSMCVSTDVGSSFLGG